MVVGNGMIANEFKSYQERDNIIIFASGVSNSKDPSIKSLNREKMLLLKTNNNYSNKHFVYFSTCSILDESLKDSLYVKHKLEMEEIVSKFKKYTIFRLPQVVGATNNNTIINFFYNKILNNKKFELWIDSKRNLIDVTDVYKIADYLLNNNLYSNKIISLATPYNIKVFDIVEIMENLMNKKANYNITQKGSWYEINIDEILKYKYIYDILDKYNYNHISYIIKKYYD